MIELDESVPAPPARPWLRWLALRTSAVGREFDCSAVAALNGHPGVSRLLVGMVQGGTGQRSVLGC